MRNSSSSGLHRSGTGMSSLSLSQPQLKRQAKLCDIFAHSAETCNEYFV